MKKNILLILMSFSLLTFCSYPEPRDVTPPLATVIYPYEGAVVSANVNVTIGASDDDEISKVWYYVDGIKMGEKSSSPYEIPLDISGLERNVNHVVQAGAVDAGGNTGYSTSVNFIVAATLDVVPPTVAIMNPQSGQTVEQQVKILAYADDDRSVQKVAFFLNGDSVGLDPSYPYFYLWNTTGYSDSTQHTIFAKAWDGGNNTAVSPVIIVTVYPRSN